MLYIYLLFKDQILKPWKKREPKVEKKAKPKEDGGDSAAEGSGNEEGSGESDTKKELKVLRQEDSPARY